MFTAKVYRVMVGSLSGAMEEVYVAKETIRKWNQQNAERTGKVFVPIEWCISPIKHTNHINHFRSIKI